MKAILMSLAIAYGIALGFALHDFSVGTALGVMLGAVATKRTGGARNAAA